MLLHDLLPRLMNHATLETSSRNPLTDVLGVEWRGARDATWSVSGLRAELTSDALDDLRVRLPFTPPTSARAALDVTATLPATWRWADDRGGRALLADVPAGFRGDLPAVFRDLELGIRMLLRSPAADASVEAVEPVGKPQIQAALRAPYWDEQAVVELPEGWELRPTIGAHPTPVSLIVDGERVRCRRVVLLSWGGGAVADAICLQALRFNARLKHARLGCIDGKLVAEACLHRDLISGETLAAAARAVAVAEHRVRMSFGILREHEEVAAPFAEMFAAPDVRPG